MYMLRLVTICDVRVLHGHDVQTNEHRFKLIFQELNFSIQWEIRVTPSQLFPRGVVTKHHGSNIGSTETSFYA